MALRSMSTRAKTSVEGNKNDKQEIEKKRSGILTNPVLGEPVHLESSRSTKRISKRKLEEFPAAPTVDVNVKVNKTKTPQVQGRQLLYAKLRETKLLSSSLLPSKASSFEAVQAQHDRELVSSQKFSTNSTGTHHSEFSTVLSNEQARKDREIESKVLNRINKSRSKNEKSKFKRNNAVQNQIIRQECEMSTFD